jgi:hypothetical protein
MMWSHYPIPFSSARSCYLMPYMGHMLLIILLFSKVRKLRIIRGFFLTMQHPLSAKVGTNFTDKPWSLGWYSSLADSGHEVFLFLYINIRFELTYIFSLSFWKKNEIGRMVSSCRMCVCHIVARQWLTTFFWAIARQWSHYLGAEQCGHILSLYTICWMY